MNPGIEPIPCKCGATPVVRITSHGIPSIARVECACGERGGAIIYTKPELAPWARWAAVDGWNLSADTLAG